MMFQSTHLSERTLADTSEQNKVEQVHVAVKVDDLGGGVSSMMELYKYSWRVLTVGRQHRAPIVRCRAGRRRCRRGKGVECVAWEGGKDGRRDEQDAVAGKSNSEAPLALGAPPLTLPHHQPPSPIPCSQTLLARSFARGLRASARVPCSSVSSQTIRTSSRSLCPVRMFFWLADSSAEY